MRSFANTLILLFLLGVTVSIAAQNKILSLQQSRARAFSELPENSGIGALEDIPLYALRTESGDIGILIFEDPQNNGFVVTHTLENAKAIIAYGFINGSPDRELPTQFLALLNEKLEELEYIYLHPEEVSTNSEAVKGTLSQVSPLITTSWDQTCFYNDDCPLDVNAPPNLCGHVWVGCVATAMGQIMKYYAYPPQGSGTHSYNSIQYGNQSVNFGNTAYDWSAMPDVLNQASPEVSQLLYHCGVSVDMNYHLLGSGSLTSVAGNALKTYFGFDPGLALHYASSYTATNWQNLLKSELDSARPFIYRSEQSGGGAGHAWVVDGYDASGLFHCNWGWGGYYNAYFALGSLTPNLNNFNQAHGALLGIKPSVSSLKAQFTAQQTLAGIAESIDFTDLSLGNASSWVWNFPGANQSTYATQNPQNVSYSQAGHFDVKLIVSDGMQNDTLTKLNYITITPLASLTADKRVIEAGGEIDFTDLSITKYPILSWLWTFPGANSTNSNSQNPTGIIYSNPGLYDVSLTITTVAGSHTLNASSYIKVYSNCDTLFHHNGKTYSIDPAIASGFSYLPEDIDQLTPYFAGAPYNHTSGWNIFNDGNINPTDTNYFLGAASLFTPPGQADNWLSFGPFPVGQEGVEFSWKHYYFSNDKRDGYELLWSATGGGHQNFSSFPLMIFGDNDPATDGDTLWKTQTIFLSDSLAGPQGIWLAFHHFANNQFYLFLDDIELISCSGLPVATRQESALNEIRLFPNPAEDYIRIEYPAPDIESLQVFSVTGKLLISENLSGTDVSAMLDVGELKQGMYILRLNSATKFYHRSFIIAR